MRSSDRRGGALLGATPSLLRSCSLRPASAMPEQTSAAAQALTLKVGELQVLIHGSVGHSRRPRRIIAWPPTWMNVVCLQRALS